MYQVIRESDNSVVMETSELSKAEYYLFFYDTEEDPHYIKNKNSEEIWN